MLPGLRHAHIAPAPHASCGAGSARPPAFLASAHGCAARPRHPATTCCRQGAAGGRPAAAAASQLSALQTRAAAGRSRRRWRRGRGGGRRRRRRRAAACGAHAGPHSAVHASQRVQHAAHAAPAHHPHPRLPAGRPAAGAAAPGAAARGEGGGWCAARVRITGQGTSMCWLPCAAPPPPTVWVVSF